MTVPTSLGHYIAEADAWSVVNSNTWLFIKLMLYTGLCAGESERTERQGRQDNQNKMVNAVTPACRHLTPPDVGEGF